MVMNGYDTDGDGENNFYTVNGRTFYYARYPIKVQLGTTVRIYLANLTEFDLLNSLHLHADFFRYQPTGTGDHWEYTDIVVQAPGPARRARDRLLAPRARSCSTRTSRSSPSSAGWATSRWSKGERPDAVDAAVARRLAPVRARARCCCWPSSSGCSSRSGSSLVDLIGRNAPPADAFDVRRVEFHPGEIRIAVRNPQSDDLTIALVTVDDAIVPFTRRRAARARPAALEHDHRALPVGRRRAVRGRHHQLDRHPDDGGDPRRRRDAHAVGRAASSATRWSGSWSASCPIALGLLWLPSLRRADAALAGGVPRAHGRACSPSSASRRCSRRSSCRRPCRRRSAAPASCCSASPRSGLGMTFLSSWLGRGKAATGGALALLVAVGIGVHNLGEGLAIGSSFAFGALQLGTLPDHRLHGPQRHRGPRHRRRQRQRADLASRGSRCSR